MSITSIQGINNNSFTRTLLRRNTNTIYPNSIYQPSDSVEISGKDKGFSKTQKCGIGLAAAAALAAAVLLMRGKAGAANKEILKETWIEAKNAAKTLISKFKNYVKIKTSKNIPNEIKPLLVNLEGKSGQEFVDIAYGNIVEYMKLNGIAPKSINIQGGDGLMSVTGGYNSVKNTIEYSQGFLKKLSPKQQINLIAHELKHCEQFTNMLRTEGIGVNGYAQAIAENSVKQALKDPLGQISFQFSYQQALLNGKGEEFIQKAIDNMTKEIIPEIETNFSEVLKLPKIKANSPDGLRAMKHLEAQRNYEGLNIFGFGAENYKNNPLEVEAYAFGDNIEKLIKDFVR